MKYNKLYRWFLTLMLALPIISIVARCIYVQKNPNAIDSYSGLQVVTNTELVTSIESNLNYELQTNTYQGDLIVDSPVYLEEKELITNYTNLNNWFTSNYDAIKYFRIYTSSNVRRIYFYDANIIQLDQWALSNTYDVIFRFKSGSNVTLQNNDIIYKINQVTSNTLDNAFTYSVNEFNNVGFNKVNFTRWFTDLFTNGDNIYTTFINSYCNYVLFSTCALALPYFLYWFITFVMGLMDRFGRKDVIR